MSLQRNFRSNLTTISKNSQVSGQFSRYTDKEQNITINMRGEERYINTRRDPRRKRKDHLWIRLYRYMSPAVCALQTAGSPVWRTM